MSDEITWLLLSSESGDFCVFNNSTSLVLKISVLSYENSCIEIDVRSNCIFEVQV